jgi:hypothetical protein
MSKDEALALVSNVETFCLGPESPSGHRFAESRMRRPDLVNLTCSRCGKCASIDTTAAPPPSRPSAHVHGDFFRAED